MDRVSDQRRSSRRQQGSQGRPGEARRATAHHRRHRRDQPNHHHLTSPSSQSSSSSSSSSAVSYSGSSLSPRPPALLSHTRVREYNTRRARLANRLTHSAPGRHQRCCWHLHGLLRTSAHRATATDTTASKEALTHTCARARAHVYDSSAIVPPPLLSRCSSSLRRCPSPPLLPSPPLSS